jgi:SpoVK/Ycf46/Vps4 family AAA+-type ATPase
MIRNFAILKLRPDVRPDQVDVLIEAMRRLRVIGMSGLIVHRDAALRPGNCDVLVVCDLEDEEERAERIQVRL